MEIVHLNLVETDSQLPNLLSELYYQSPACSRGQEPAFCHRTKLEAVGDKIYLGTPFLFVHYRQDVIARPKDPTKTCDNCERKAQL